MTFVSAILLLEGRGDVRARWSTIAAEKLRAIPDHLAGEFAGVLGPHERRHLGDDVLLVDRMAADAQGVVFAPVRRMVTSVFSEGSTSNIMPKWNFGSLLS